MADAPACTTPARPRAPCPDPRRSSPSRGSAAGWRAAAPRACSQSRPRRARSAAPGASRCGARAEALRGAGGVDGGAGKGQQRSVCTGTYTGRVPMWQALISGDAVVRLPAAAMECAAQHPGITGCALPLQGLAPLGRKVKESSGRRLVRVRSLLKAWTPSHTSWCANQDRCSAAATVARSPGDCASAWRHMG